MVYFIGNEAGRAKDHRQAAKLLIHESAKTKWCSRLSQDEIADF